MLSHFLNASEVQDIIFLLTAISARVVTLFCLASSQERRHFALTVVIIHQKLSNLRRIFTQLIQPQSKNIYYCYFMN